MQTPFNTPLGFIGFLMLGLGVFLLLAGFSILNIERISVKPGRGTWTIGFIFSVIGVYLLIVGDSGNKPGNANSPALMTPLITTPTLVETPEIAPSPTPSLFDEKDALLADARQWPLTEAEAFDSSDSAWLGFGTSEDNNAKHNQRIEDGKLLWGFEPLQPAIWYWQVSPYFSYRDFYLAFKFKRDREVKNFTYYGLIFRKQGKKFYMFRINDDQRFAVQLYNDGDWADLIGWTKSAEIKLGEFNELVVIADGPNMTFFINKIYVGDAKDDASNNGEVGLTVAADQSGPEMLFEFDDFELREKP
jgi:hypothetical protein